MRQTRSRVTQQTRSCKVGFQTGSFPQGWQKKYFFCKIHCIISLISSTSDKLALWFSRRFVLLAGWIFPAKTAWCFNIVLDTGRWWCSTWKKRLKIIHESKLWPFSPSTLQINTLTPIQVSSRLPVCWFHLPFFCNPHQYSKFLWTRPGYHQRLSQNCDSQLEN